MDRVTNICTHVKKYSQAFPHILVCVCVCACSFATGRVCKGIVHIHCTCGCGYTALMEIMCYGVLYTVLIQGSGDEQNMVGVCVYKVQ